MRTGTTQRLARLAHRHPGADPGALGRLLVRRRSRSPRAAIDRVTMRPVAGGRFACAGQTLGGFPLRLDFGCARAAYGDGPQGTGERLSAALGGLQASAPLYWPGYVEATLTGPFVVNAPRLRHGHHHPMVGRQHLGHRRPRRPQERRRRLPQPRFFQRRRPCSAGEGADRRSRRSVRRAGRRQRLSLRRHRPWPESRARQRTANSRPSTATPRSPPRNSALRSAPTRAPRSVPGPGPAAPPTSTACASPPAAPSPTPTET